MLWLMTMFMFFIVSSVLSEDYQEPPFISEISQCLLRARFLHPPSGRCLEPLERGPCADNQWLVPSKLNKMLLECQEKPENEGDTSFTAHRSGDIRPLKDHTYLKMFSRGHCEAAEKLLPVNFAMNTRPCPHDHRCSSDISVAIKILKSLIATNGYKIVQNFFRKMICGREPQKRAICLPVDKKSPLTEENLYNSLHIPDLVCVKKNPCPYGEGPYQNKEGYFGCKNISFIRLLNFSSRRCRRRKILRRGRCVPRFIG